MAYASCPIAGTARGLDNAAAAARSLPPNAPFVLWPPGQEPSDWGILGWVGSSAILQCRIRGKGLFVWRCKGVE